MLLSSRHPEDLSPGGWARPAAKAGTVAEAIGFGDVIFIAVPYEAYPQIAKDYGPKFAGKVVLDAGNAIARARRREL